MCATKHRRPSGARHDQHQGDRRGADRTRKGHPGRRREHRDDVGSAGAGGRHGNRGQQALLSRTAVHHARIGRGGVRHHLLRRDPSPGVPGRHALRRRSPGARHPARHQGRHGSRARGGAAGRDGHGGARRAVRAAGALRRHRRGVRQVARRVHHRRRAAQLGFDHQQRQRTGPLRRGLPGGRPGPDRRTRGADDGRSRARPVCRDHGLGARRGATAAVGARRGPGWHRAQAEHGHRG